MERRARIGRALMLAIVVVVVLAFVLVPARAADVPPPGPHELTTSFDHEWVRFRRLCVRVGLCERQRGFFESIPPPTTTTSPPPATTSAPAATTAPAPVVVAAGVEQWRDLVAAYFPASEVETALRVMACESGGDPSAYNPSGATGLMQIMTPLWSDHYGIPAEALFDPETNISIAALVWASQGWPAWSCY